MRRLAVSFAIALLALALPSLTRAGSICGTVRDATTGAPVAHAGVFVRTTGGAYTGKYGATDASGAFCIAFVQPGTYDLDVEVDHYQVAYVRGVVVTGTVSVDVPAAPGLRLAASPNPAHDAARIAWTLPASGPARVTAVDLRGRVLREWGAESLAPGEHAITWNFTDRSGRSVGAGVYFIRLETAAGVRQSALVRVR